jgi:hypothetical protein
MHRISVGLHKFKAGWLNNAQGVNIMLFRCTMVRLHFILISKWANCNQTIYGTRILWIYALSMGKCTKTWGQTPTYDTFAVVLFKRNKWDSTVNATSKSFAWSASNWYVYQWVVTFINYHHFCPLACLAKLALSKNRIIFNRVVFWRLQHTHHSVKVRITPAWYFSHRSHAFPEQIFPWCLMHFSKIHGNLRCKILGKRHCG